MDIRAEKLSIIQRLLQVDDESLIRAIQGMLDKVIDIAVNTLIYIYRQMIKKYYLPVYV